MSAALVNNALVSDETVVTNPVIPLLTEASSSSGFALLLLSVAVLAPLFVETFFRGFLYRAIRERLGVGAAVALSATAFALVHLSFQTMLPLFALGCVLAMAYDWTGSLVPSIVLHSVNNLYQRRARARHHVVTLLVAAGILAGASIVLAAHRR